MNRRREGDPAWVEDLLRLLPNPMAQQGMPLQDITREVIDWIDYADADSWSKNAGVLRRELDESLRSMPPSLRRLIARELKAVRNAIVAGTSSVSTVAARRTLRAALEALNGSLATPIATGAAWDDLITALQRDNPTDDATVASAALSATSQQLGKDDLQRRKTAATVIEAFNWEARNRADPAGAPTLLARLAEAREIMTRAEKREHCAVWFEYDHIAVQNYEWTHGPITLISFGWALPNARNPDGESFAHRDELRELLRSHDDFPPDSELVTSFRAFARIELPATAPSEAPQRARDLLETVRQIAVPDTGLRWRQGEFSAIFVEGQLQRTEYEPQDPPTWVDAHRAHFTSDRFSERAPAILDGLQQHPLPPQVSAALQIMANVEPDDRRPRAAGNGAIIDERATVVLQLQAVEHIAGWMQHEPQHLIDDLVEIWAVTRVLRRSAEVAHRLARRSDSAILLQLGRHLGEVNWDLIVDHSRELLALANGPLERAESRAAFAALYSPTHFLAARKRAQDGLALERARHRRVRNALAHGNPLQNSALRSVARLGRSLANMSIAFAMDAHLAGEHPAAKLKRSVGDARYRVSQAERGTSIADSARPVSSDSENGSARLLLAPAEHHTRN